MTKDPAGKKTTGITRTATKAASFGVHDEVKSSKTGGADPWPTDSYLNFWACNLGEGLLGYAQFPGGPTKTDGVVILFRAFGTTGAVKAPFDKGRTATHEVGHFLGLRHIWGDMNDCTGNDFVADTGMWLAVYPPAQTDSAGAATSSTNPFIDDHMINALVLVVLALTYAGTTWGLGRRWARLPFVSKHRWAL